MVILITRTLLGLQVLAAGLLSVAFMHLFNLTSAWLALLMGVATVVMLRMLITASGFILAWRYRSHHPHSAQLNWRATCRLFAGEFRASMLSTNWAMPFFARAGDEFVSAKPAGLPVLLVHGYGCNSGFWKSLSAIFRTAEISHRAVNLEPVFTSIDAYVPLLEREIGLLCQASGKDRLTIVAHSMGGLAIRAYLQHSHDSRIAKVITLGTPHHGTALAHYSMGVNCRQMSWRGSAENGVPSAWLQQLGSLESPARRAIFVSIYSWHDNIVAPQTSCHLPGATNISLHGVGHVAMSSDPAVCALITKEVLTLSCVDLPCVASGSS